MTAPHLGAADAELMRLETAAKTIAANLVDLDDNPARKDLDKGPLTGRTATAWAQAGEALTQLWDGYRLLTDLIADARALRDQRRFTDADKAAYIQLVLGSSVTLSTRTVPLAQRGLLGPGQVSTTCTPAQLLSAMEAAFTSAVEVAARAGEVWQRILPEAAAVAAALDHVRTLTRAAGGATATLDEADRRLGVFTGTLAGDPLGVNETDLATVRALVERADAERTSAVELRAALGRRLADARTLLLTLAAADEEAALAHAAAAGRFTDDGPSAGSAGGGATADSREVRAGLAAVEALAAAGQWSLISSRLADWTRAANARLDLLRAAAAHHRGLLAERNELRGRLDAYRAKALGRGLGEDADLSDRAQVARDALFTAPCDLAAARAAVNAYQDALTQLIDREGRS